MSHECPADSLRFAAIHLSIRGMLVSVNVQTVYPRKVAAVRREVEPGAVGSVWGPAVGKVWDFIRSQPREVAPGAVGSVGGPAVGKVWDFIRSQPGFWTDGHNIFLYHHPKQPGAPILCNSASRSRAHLKTRARCTRPKRQGAKPPSPSTAGRTIA